MAAIDCTAYSHFKQNPLIGVFSRSGKNTPQAIVQQVRMASGMNAEVLCLSTWSFEHHIGTDIRCF